MYGAPSCPMKKVSARLYIIETIWLIIVGTASAATAFGTGISSKSSFSETVFIVPPLLSFYFPKYKERPPGASGASRPFVCAACSAASVLFGARRNAPRAFYIYAGPTSRSRPRGATPSPRGRTPARRCAARSRRVLPSRRARAPLSSRRCARSRCRRE